MKPLLTILLICVESVGFSQTDDFRKKQFNLEDGVAIKGYDPVAYFTMSKAEKGKCGADRIGLVICVVPLIGSVIASPQVISFAVDARWILVSALWCAAVTFVLTLVCFALKSCFLPEILEAGYPLSMLVSGVLCLLTSVYLFGDGMCSERQLILVGLLCLWALRLALFLVLRIRFVPAKYRARPHFVDLQQRVRRVVPLMVYQYLAIWVNGLSVYYTLGSPPNSIALSAFDYAAIALVGVGVALSTLVDCGKFMKSATKVAAAMEKTPPNTARTASTSLVANTIPTARHIPWNYIGDILVFWGFFICSVPLLLTQTWQWVSIGSAVHVTAACAYFAGAFGDPPSRCGWGLGSHLVALDIWCR